MADKSVVTRRQRGRYREYGRHNQSIYISSCKEMKREPPKPDKNRQMLVTMGSTNRKPKVSFSKV